MIRQDEPAPAQPWWRPPGQCRSIPHRRGQVSFELRTQAYMRRRTAEGMSKREVIRCLKRYVAREVYSAILKPAQILDKAA